MNKQNLIVYQFNTLLELLKELEENLNFKIVEAKNENSLKEKINISKKYIIITKKKLLGKDNQIVMEKFPIKLFLLYYHKKIYCTHDHIFLQLLYTHHLL